MTALLDDERGGPSRSRPAGEQYRAGQLYHPDSAILITRFPAEAGAGEALKVYPVAWPPFRRIRRSFSGRFRYAGCLLPAGARR